MANITTTTIKTTYEFSNAIICMPIWIVIAVCIFLLLRVYIIEKTKRIECETDIIKASLKSLNNSKDLKVENVEAIMKKREINVETKSWYWRFL